MFPSLVVRYADKYLIHFSKPLYNICKETFADKLMDSGRALAFNPANPSNYLIGTDEGDIYLCTNEYASQYKAKYQARVVMNTKTCEPNLDNE